MTSKHDLPNMTASEVKQAIDALPGFQEPAKSLAPVLDAIIQRLSQMQLLPRNAGLTSSLSQSQADELITEGTGIPASYVVRGRD